MTGGQMQIDDWTWDIEGTGLLDDNIDYTKSPYRLKQQYAHHCYVFENHRTGEIVAFHNGQKYEFDGREYVEEIGGEVYELKEYVPLDYTHYPLSAFKGWLKEQRIGKLIAHNQITFDLVAVKLFEGIDFSIGMERKEGGLTTWEADKWDGQKINFVDTLVYSKCLNPDRYGGHSLDKLSEGLSIRKIAFRKHMHESVRFQHFAADMLYYCIYDVKSNTMVYRDLFEKYNLNDRTEFMKWVSALQLEKGIAELISRQQHRGFHFDRDLAYKNLDELDALMEERRIRVEPMLPPRPATQAFMKDFTPPKKQFKQDLSLSTLMEKFIAKHNGVMIEDRKVEMFGNVWDLPLAPEPMVTTMRATIDDTTHIKNWLVGLGWQPSEYKEKDITVDTKKNKLPTDKLEISIGKYVDQTFELEFKQDRLEHLGYYKSIKPEMLKQKLMDKANRSLKVLTNPSFTKGQDKEMCPDLDRISAQFPFAKDVVEYLTYKHRRNSILGGGADWDDPEEEPEKGYLAGVREDGRIATPADTCGAATSRFKHRKVANIPRVTSLFGEQLRALFGVSEGYFQIGYDFDSLEARIESAYCWQYDEELKGYCKSLMLDKPNDVHTKMAQAISAIIGREFGRAPAKNVKYGLTNRPM
jgi:hypothetical protein